MKISSKKVQVLIEDNLDKLGDCLSIRICHLLGELVDGELSEDEQIDLFDLLVRFVMLADREPAEVIANFLTPLNSESLCQLDDWIISSATSFLRDYLRKDHVSEVLDDRDKIVSFK